MEYRVSHLNAELEAAHKRLFPASNELLRAKLHDGGLVASAMMDGQIVGLNAFIRVVMKVRGRRVVGFQSFDTLVDPVARGRGVFTGLLQAFYRHEHGGSILYGFPNTNSAPGFFGKLGWARLGTPPFLIKPLRAGYATRKLGLNMDFPLSFARPAGEPFDVFGEDASELWNKFSENIGCAVERSSAYLNHRLSMRKYSKFGLFAKGKLRGYVSTRIADKHGGSIGYVMEAIGEGLPSLISGAVGHMRAQGAEVALAWCAPWSPNFRAYLQAGFFPLPERLRPIQLNFGARAFTPECYGLSRKDWYISYLDSDTV